MDETKCENWLECIGHYRRPWDDRRGMFGDSPVHDYASHPADMWRYAAIIEDKMTNLRVVKRRPMRPTQEGPNAGLAG